MQVGLVEASQHESLIDLLCEVHAYYNDGAQASRPDVREHLLANLLSLKSPHRLVVASAGDAGVVGLAAITMVYSLVDFDVARRSHCQLKELYVRASHRSRGVGRALMAWVARHAQAQGCGRIDWPVKASNARGQAFYEGLGAARVTDRLSYRLTQPHLDRLARSAGPA